MLQGVLTSDFDWFSKHPRRFETSLRGALQMPLNGDDAP